MKNNLNQHENDIWKNHFPECSNYETREDLIFLYPSNFCGDPNNVADVLQVSIDFLKYVTNLNPTQDFRSRVLVGYTHLSSQPNWRGKYGNRIHLPMKKYLNIESEPFDVCSHELVHPFFNRSPLHISNEAWGDCFCEFLRGPLKNIMGLDGKKWWNEKIIDYKLKNQNYGNVAGQFLLDAKEKYGDIDETEVDFIDHFIENRNIIKNYVYFLFSDFAVASFSTYFVPTSKIKIF